MTRFRWLAVLLSLSLLSATPAMARTGDGATGIGVVPALGFTPPGHAIATAHPLATQAGERILSAGGNAFDAAIAVAAALAVVEPYGSGLGGGGFFLLHRAFDDRDTFLDARETAPIAATGDMYLDRRERLVRELSLTGPLAAAIPGTPAAIEHLARLWGKLPLEQSLAPAIRLAREGFPADTRLVERIREEAARLSPAAREVFMPGGRVPDVGQSIVQRDLANTLEALAREGGPGFYQGEVGRRLQEGVFRDGGIWSPDDLTRYRVRERAPHRFIYRGHEITTAPLPSAGGVTLQQTFQTLEALDWPPADGALARHQLTEALRYAYRDRAIYLGDSDFISVPLPKLLSREYAARNAARIGDRAQPSRHFDVDRLQAQRAASRVDGQTTHFSIIDRDGNRVAATLTINTWFGSGYMPPGTGVLLNNEMDDFATAPLVPNAFGLVHTESNAIQPHKRPLSSMSPTFVTGPRGVLVLGTPGGSRIITMVMLGILSHLNGLSLDEVVATPRIHHQFLPDELQYESGALSASQIDGLQGRGHALNEFTRGWGNMQAVHWDRVHQMLYAAADPRGIGMARVHMERRPAYQAPPVAFPPRMPEPVPAR